ncbi:MAG TPA: PepSY domain-containing protein [Mycobacteriales bacterium]|nr:PepSY domain-containing protein [Mycobacteriales bacterium]
MTTTSQPPLGTPPGAGTPTTPTAPAGRPAAGRRSGSGPAAGGGRVWPVLRPVVLRLHFWAGVLVAPFLAIAALTGLLYAATPQVDQLLYSGVLHAASASGAVLPVDRQVAAARAAHPEGTVAAVEPAADPGATTRVVLDVPGLGEDKQRTVFVDPHTGAVRGSLTTWWDATPATTWVDGLHRTLHLGQVGRVYSEAAASWLWVLVLGGLALWVGRRRRRRRHLLAADLSASGRRRTLGWHAPTGVWVALPLLFLSATGLTWSHYAGDRFSALLDATRGHAPELDTALPAGPPAAGATVGGGHAGHHTTPAVPAPGSDAGGYDRVLAAAHGAGLDGPVKITPASGQAWTAAQIDNRWPVRLDQAAIDPTTGTVVHTTRWPDYPVAAKLSKLGVQAHMGVLFGPVNQILLAAVALGLLCLIVWGYRMWWQRRPAGTARLAAAPAPGAWRRLPKLPLALTVAAVAALGWALPVLGVSLALFLLLDAVGTLISRTRSRPASTRPQPTASAR